MSDTALDVPRTDLRRNVRFDQVESDGRTLEGYAAVFNDWTTIYDRAGEFQERIAPGAFKRSLGIRTPVLQFDHGAHPMLGSIPLGRFTKIEEDERGLFVRARLSDNWLIQPVRDAIADGALEGMSFRFSVTEDHWENVDGEDRRTITGVNLYEAGPVVFPAYPTTSVGVRSRQLVDALTDPEVRQELAVIFSMGTDQLRDLAEQSHSAPDPDTPTDEVTRDDTDAPTDTRHGVRNKNQRQAIARLALSQGD